MEMENVGSSNFTEVLVKFIRESGAKSPVSLF